jgi:hypothetical protein
VTVGTIILLCTITVVGSVCLVLYLMYRKLSQAIDRLGNQSKNQANNVITQIEALLALQTELNLRHALPPARGWAASPDFLHNLVMHTLRDRPLTVVECSSGISTIVLARCMEILGKGHVYSLEHDKEYAEKTRALLRLHALEHFATVCDAPLKSITLPGWSGQWYSHEVLPDDLKIDLLVIDGPPWFVAELARYPAVPVLHDRFNPHAAVFLDDADREGEKISVKRWLDEFSDLAAVRVPVCEKGCVALKKSVGRDLAGSFV